MTNKTKIQEKIKKLLALSESSNQHEAELAMGRAQQLMTKYSIDMADVLVNVSADDITADTAEIKGDSVAWIAILGMACGNLFDCETVRIQTGRVGGYRTLIRYYGTTENIQSARHLFYFLYPTWKSISAADYKTYKAETPAYAQTTRRRFIVSHGVGFAGAILDRVSALREEREQELEKASPEAGLVPVKMAQAVKAYMDEHTGKLGKGRAARSHTAAGRLAGAAAGKNVAFGGAIHGNAGYLS